MIRNAIRKRLVRGTLFAATCASFPIGIAAGLVYLVILHEQDVIRRTEPDRGPAADELPSAALHAWIVSAIRRTKPFLDAQEPAP